MFDDFEDTLTDDTSENKMPYKSYCPDRGWLDVLRIL